MTGSAAAVGALRRVRGGHRLADALVRRSTGGRPPGGAIDLVRAGPPRPLPAYHFTARANFGDAMAPAILSWVAGRPTLPVTTGYRGKVLSTGSVIQRALEPGDVVWGSGLILERPTPVPPAATVLAVRGPRTRACLDGPVPETYGDPALLLPRFVDPAPARTHAVGLVPHYFDQPVVGTPPGATVIDVGRPWREVVAAITACELVVSSSLHGIIVAEAYGIPAVWMTVPGGRERDPFKYHDHLAATGRSPVEPWPWPGSLAGVEEAVLPPPVGIDGLADGLVSAWRQAAGDTADAGATAAAVVDPERAAPRVPMRGTTRRRAPLVVRRARRRLRRVALAVTVRPTPIEDLWPGHARVGHDVGETSVDSSESLTMEVLDTHRRFQVARTTFPAPEVHLVDRVVYAARWNLVLKDRPRRLVAELVMQSNNTTGSPMALRSGAVEHHDGLSAIFRGRSRGYAHTLIEDIPRLALLDHPALADEAIRVLVPGPLFEPEARLAPLLLPRNATIEVVEPGRLHLLARAAIPTEVASPLALPRWYLDRLDAVLDHPGSRRPGRRLYLSRGPGVRRRRVRNEDEVVALLEERGFDVLDPETMTFDEQVEAFADAAVVVSPHGAALANLIFARSALVIELFPNRRVQPAFYLLGLTAGHRHRHLLGDGQHRDDDFHCPVAELRRLLDDEGL